MFDLCCWIHAKGAFFYRAAKPVTLDIYHTTRGPLSVIYHLTHESAVLYVLSLLNYQNWSKACRQLKLWSHSALEIITEKYNLSTCKPCKAAGRNLLAGLPLKQLQSCPVYQSNESLNSGIIWLSYKSFLPQHTMIEHAGVWAITAFNLILPRAWALSPVGEYI